MCSEVRTEIFLKLHRDPILLIHRQREPGLCSLAGCLHGDWEAIPLIPQATAGQWCNIPPPQMFSLTQRNLPSYVICKCASPDTCITPHLKKTTHLQVISTWLVLIKYSGGIRKTQAKTDACAHNFTCVYKSSRFSNKILETLLKKCFPRRWF